MCNCTKLYRTTRLVSSIESVAPLLDELGIGATEVLGVVIGDSIREKSEKRGWN